VKLTAFYMQAGILRATKPIDHLTSVNCPLDLYSDKQ